MHLPSTLILAAAVAVSAASQLPSLDVPACPNAGTISYNTSVPSTDPASFPETEVSLCYDDAFIHINFTALDEESFYYNDSIPANGNIYDYEVMEAFIYLGCNDPQTYLEFEVAPNNVTFSALIYNPSKVRASGAPFDRFYMADLAADKMVADTALDTPAGMWQSRVQIPLGLFNVDDGEAQGTEWRMNFFRTVTSPDAFPTQQYGGWSPPNETNFHMTPFFGAVRFV